MAGVLKLEARSPEHTLHASGSIFPFVLTPGASLMPPKALTLLVNTQVQLGDSSISKTILSLDGNWIGLLHPSGTLSIYDWRKNLNDRIFSVAGVTWFSWLSINAKPILVTVIKDSLQLVDIVEKKFSTTPASCCFDESSSSASSFSLNLSSTGYCTESDFKCLAYFYFFSAFLS